MSGGALLALAGAGGLFLADAAASAVLLAIASVSRVALRRMAAEGGAGLAWLEDLKTPLSPHRMAVQVVRQACLLGGTGLLVVAARQAGAAVPGAVGLAAGILVGVLGLETFAARLAVQGDPRAVLRGAAPALPWVRRLLWPVLAPLHLLLAARARPVEDAEERDEEQAEEEVEAFFEVGEREGILEADEGKMMRGIVDLDDTRVREIMTPRTDVVALPAETPVAEARRVLIEAAHSRIPVYRGSIDDVVGILHVRDLVRAWEQGRDGAPIAGYLRPAFFVPETLSVGDLLGEMKARTHVAIVVDEYGGVAGLVTLEDVLEEIVGEIRDEHDPEDLQWVQDVDGSWLVNGLAHVEELESRFGVDLPEREYDTVGGLVVATAGRVPEAGEVLEVQGLTLEVVHADPRRVYRVRVRPHAPGARAGAGA